MEHANHLAYYLTVAQARCPDWQDGMNSSRASCPYNSGLTCDQVRMRPPNTSYCTWTATTS
eukprot:1263806-Pleurochrysis_carterae.AAC.1